MNTAGHICSDQRANILVLDYPLALGKARHIATITESHILQLTFAALITNRAVQRMINEQELHRSLLRSQSLRRLGIHLHPFHHRRRASRQGLGRSLNLDQTHSAVGGDGKLLVVTEAGDCNTRGVSDFNEHRALTRLQRDAIHFNIDPFLAHLLPIAAMWQVSRTYAVKAVAPTTMLRLCSM